jgi:hypothetical protein
MRPMMIALAAAAFAAAPAAAQDREADTIRGAAGAIQEAAPAIDRAADAMLNLDIGPLLDAAKPYGPPIRRHRTLREMAHRSDPYFEQHMRESIYGTSARASRVLGALAASEPALRQSLRQMEANMRAALDGAAPYPTRPYRTEPRAAPPPPSSTPPGDVDDDWDRDLDEGGPDDEPNNE